ncbi:MAG: hypothetical protein Q9218_001898 [Villophora microphyllina]
MSTEHPKRPHEDCVAECPILKSLGYDFNFSDWPTLGKIMEDGMIQFEFYNHQSIVLLARVESDMTQQSITETDTYSPALAAIYHETIKLACKFVDYQNALQMMVWRAQDQYVELWLMHRTTGNIPCASRWTMTESKFLPGQPVNFFHEAASIPSQPFGSRKHGKVIHHRYISDAIALRRYHKDYKVSS